jgi:hypothetical protein
MASSDSKIAKIQTHFQTLSSVAPTLNAASDELTKAVGYLDVALKQLNVGISVWVTFADLTENPGDGEYDLEQIGYTKLNGEWGLALRHVWGDHVADHHSSEGPWLFSDGPRDLRLSGVDKIPEVVEQLGSEASSLVKRVQEKTKQVHELAAAITEINKLPKIPVLHNITEAQVEAIKENTREHQKFVADLLGHAFGWERSNDELRIRFLFEKRSFAELLKAGKTNSLVSGAVNHVLGLPMKLVVAVEPARFPRTAASAAKKEGSK